MTALEHNASATRSVRSWPRERLAAIASRRPLPLRARLLIVVLFIDLACCLAAAFVEVGNARRAARVEVAASFEMAEPLVRETVANFQRTGGKDIAALSFTLPGIRHVRISVHRPDGELVSSRVANRTEESEPAPEWFAQLISSPTQRIEIPVAVDGRMLGMVAIHGEDADEAAEVWDDMTSLALLVAALNTVGLAAFAVSLGRLLAPLGALADGLSALERHQLESRLPVPKSEELAALAKRFNALAAGLAAERETNERLSRRMVSLQDDERRQVAMELHDELGPCVFGVRANLGLIESAAAAGKADLGENGRERLAAAIDIAERLQTLNSRLLRRLKPIALGEAPLAEVLGGLMADFESHHPDRDFDLSADGLRASYGSVVDLTVYRCVQEGVTNALKHGDCGRVSVTIRELGRADRAELAVHIMDDGDGPPDPISPGLGLSGLQERLRAIQGRMSLRAEGPGAALEATIPLDETSGAARP